MHKNDEPASNSMGYVLFIKENMKIKVKYKNHEIKVTYNI